MGVYPGPAVHSRHALGQVSDSQNLCFPHGNRITPTSPELRARRCNLQDSIQHVPVNIIYRGGSKILTHCLTHNKPAHKCHVIKLETVGAMVQLPLTKSLVRDARLFAEFPPLSKSFFFSE